MSKRLTYTLLGVIVVIAFGVRAWGIREKGLYLHDEGDIMLRVRTYTTLLRVFPQAVLTWWRGDALAPRTFSYAAFPSGFFPSLSAMPSHIIPGVFIALLFGEPDWSLVLWNILLGSLTVLTVFLLVRRLSGNALAGLVAALLLALSPYHILYSRTAHAQLSATFFFSLAALLYVESFYASERVRYRYLFFTGVALALMASSQFGTLFVLLLFGSVELVVGFMCFREQCAGRWGVFATGVALPLLTWQILLLFRAGLLVRVGYDPRDAQSYIGEVLGMIRTDAYAPLKMNVPRYAPLFFFNLIRYAQGGFFTALLAASSILAIPALRRRSAVYGAFVWLAWAPIIAYGMFYYRVPRMFVICIPLAIAAVVLVLHEAAAFITHITRKHITAFVISLTGVFLVFAELPKLKDIINLRSPYPSAAREVQTLSDARTVVATPWTLYQYYGNARIESFSSLQEKVQPVIYVADWSSLENSRAVHLQENRVPFLEIPNPISSNYFLLRDILADHSDKSIRFLAGGGDPQRTPIRFYDLAQP